MSTLSDALYHPVNGTPEQTWRGWSWPGFLFGVFWSLYKGMALQAVLLGLICVVTGGFAAPFVWIYYGVAGNDSHRKSLLKKGYLTQAQWNERQSAAGAPAATAEARQRSNPYDQLAQLKKLKDDGALTEEEFNTEKAKLLSA